MRVVRHPVRPRPTSIKDIARIADVSHSTVSRALRNSPLVKPETADKIRRIARESGYKASAVARGLVMRETRSIGVVVTTIADPFVGDVVSGIDEAAHRSGYSVFLAESNAEPEREKNVVHSFAERRVDGIIVTSSRVGSLYIPVLAEMMVPIVLVNNQHPGEFVHSVLIDNVDGGRRATEHLIRLGHRRIAYVGDRYGRESDKERYTGYREALRQAGAGFSGDLVAHGDGKPEGGMAAMDTLLGLANPPTAVFCYNDMSALGALRAIHRRGLNAPDDISLAGFDDLFLASYTQPPLTTVHQPMRRMGMLAMEILLKLMAGEDSANTVRIPAELIIRESTGPVRRRPL